MNEEAIRLDSGALEYLDRLRTLQARFTPETPLAELRQAALEVRQFWNVGGPLPRQIQETQLSVSGGSVKLRWYHPAKDGTGLLVYFHGGGWAMLGLDTHDRLLRETVAASEWTVVSVDYPLAPETRFPTTVEICAEVAQELRQLWRNQGHQGPIVLAGDSAGANLAMGATLALRDWQESLPEGLLLHYGVFDADFGRASYTTYSQEPLQLTGARMAWYWNQYCPDPALRRHPWIAPVHAELDGLPPVGLTIAQADVLVDENEELANKLLEAGNQLTVWRVPGVPHGFMEAVALCAPARETLQQNSVWLQAL